ncbi:MAG: aspartyl-phosphate phosphatase Spo0E family protein [Epulopiscium sp.]|nr:aspartyl-phosphate phosphatase Spo0E family protein [Candidatus Epulonipiscium sp.]
MNKHNCHTTEEIEALKTALDTLLEQRNYNFLDPLVQQLSRKLDILINKVIEQQTEFSKAKNKTR